MQIVSVINYKGGVGKTSLTANLGAELAWRGKRVLLIDLDAQASLTFSFIRPDEWTAQFEENRTIKAWFDSYEGRHPISLRDIVFDPENTNDIIRGKGRLAMICSHLGLINVDLELATKLGGANIQQAKRNFISVHRRLADALRQNEISKDFDLILIDCPPNFNIVTKTAIIASDHILVPTRPDQLSTLGISYLIRSINTLIKEYNEFIQLEPDPISSMIRPSIAGIIFTMIQEYASAPIAAQAEYIQRVRRDLKLHVFGSYIKRNDTMFASAPDYGVPVVLNRYSHPSHRGVVDGIEDVTSEFSLLIGV